MDVSRFKQCALWLVVVAYVASCATTTPVPETATAPVLATMSIPLPTAPSAAAPPAQLPEYWPTDGWRASTAEEQGVDFAQLVGMVDAINDQKLDIHSLLVVRNGYIIAETYSPPFSRDTRHRIYSVTKSFISALVGIAIDLGFIDGVESRAIDFFPEHEFAQSDEPKAVITLEHLLTMTTGLDWEEGMSRQEMGRTSDWVRYVLDKPIKAKPGQQFNYCSGCSHVMSAIVQETSGMDTLEFAEKHLFAPLGISNVFWGTDGSGIPNGGWGLEITPRDMAKLGYLYLNDGVWDGQQIIPLEWVRASLSQRIQADEEWFYGYQWWVNPSSGAYAAIGFGAQLIYVIPELDIVVVFTAGLDDNSVLFEFIDDYVVPAAKRAP